MYAPLKTLSMPFDENTYVWKSEIIWQHQHARRDSVIIIIIIIIIIVIIIIYVQSIDIFTSFCV